MYIPEKPDHGSVTNAGQKKAAGNSATTKSVTIRFAKRLPRAANPPIGADE
jgi:hypothetical protein